MNNVSELLQPICLKHPSFNLFLFGFRMPVSLITTSLYFVKLIEDHTDHTQQCTAIEKYLMSLDHFAN